MPDDNSVSLARMVQKLATHSRLTDDDRAVLLNLPSKVRSFEPGSYMNRDNDHSTQCIVLISGFAFRHKISKDGKRQIVSIHLAGEVINLQSLFLEAMDHNLQALTRCSVVLIPILALRSLIFERPPIYAAFITSSMVEASIYREWILNNGRRDARARIAHLLCEFAVRSDALGINHGGIYNLPMTQEQIGDAVGLTAVHVNRTLKSLSNDGLITQSGRGVTFPDWDRLKDEAGFNTRYLHMSQSGEPG
ncbi:CRP-like cAMP-binding protein [Sphingomonas faeni]|uniref:CRP-like cAMP-binding protein n=2 Tax=Sphingomonas faeni TaxID=185950 RepID=A0A2T5U8W6_9SPHN|nr:CRP-like cAMP-binding protein [Sphingomonas faeni]